MNYRSSACFSAMVLAALVGGCGGSDRASDKPSIRNPPSWTEAQIIEAVRLTTDNNGISYKTPSGCRVAVILTSKNAVELYAGAGDTVVTNPAGTAGVKASASEPRCLPELERGLAELK